MKRFFLLGFLLLGGCVADGGDQQATVTPALLDEVPALSALAGTPTSRPQSLPTLAPSLVAIGAEVYATHCAECHGTNLEGETEWQMPNPDGSFRAPPHDETGHTWHHGDRVLREAILLGGDRLQEIGHSEMPAFAGTLSDEQVDAVLAYIKSNWPEDIRATQWEQSGRDPLQ